MLGRPAGERRAHGGSPRLAGDVPAANPSPPEGEPSAADGIRAILGAGEEIRFILPGIGSTMVGTDRRVLVAREGRGWRPRSGLRSYELAAIQRVTLEGGPGRSGRIVLSLGPLYYQAVSMFFEASAADGAAEAIRILRASVGPRSGPGPAARRRPGA